MKKSNPTIKAQILRSAFYLLLLLGICAIPFALAQWSFDGRTASATSSKQIQRTLTFAGRVAYQGALEQVYWRHRIWPKENLRPKPSLDDAISAKQIEQKAEDLRSGLASAGSLSAKADHFRAAANRNGADGPIHKTTGSLAGTV